MERDPILMDVPEAFETARLALRAPRAGDGAAVAEAVQESLPELRRWLAFAQVPPDPVRSELNVRRARAAYLERRDLRLHLWDLDTGRFVGASGLHRIDWGARRFEVGYWLRSSAGGRGLMTEAVEGIVAFARDRLEANRVEIRCDVRNLRSRRIPERLGFTLEGILRKGAQAPAGGLEDVMVFAKVRGIEL